MNILHLSFLGSLASEMHYSYALLVFQRLKMARLAHGFLSHILTECLIGLWEEDSSKTLRHEKVSTFAISARPPTSLLDYYCYT